MGKFIYQGNLLYQDYVILINGGQDLVKLIPNATPRQVTGVPDLQMEVFDDVVATFDCQNLNTLPLGAGKSHIFNATSEFKSKYLLMQVVLLAASDSDKRRSQFFRMITIMRNAPQERFEGSNEEIAEIIEYIIHQTPRAIQEEMGIKSVKGRYGRMVHDTAKYIYEVANNGIVPVPIGGVDELCNIYGIGPKTARLYYRWMARGSPDLGLWQVPVEGLQIPVDRRILKTCFECIEVLGPYYPEIARYRQHANRWLTKNGKSIQPCAFAEVTQFVSEALGFGSRFMDVDYPFWLLGRISEKEKLPSCYQRINSLGTHCPLTELNLPKCLQSHCPFLERNNRKY